MSHIPSSAMPHAQAHGDSIDGQPDPAKATPKSSAGQPAVDGGVTAQNAPAPATPVKDAPAQAEHRSGIRSPTAIAALAIGGVAVIGGVAAALYANQDAKAKAAPKSKKKRARKKA